MRPETGAALLAAALAAAVLLSSMPAVAAERPSFDRPDNWFDDHVYHHHADLTTELSELAADHPGLVTLDSIGTSVRGRELWCVRITDPRSGAEGKRGIYVDGAHHGNEYLSCELAVLLIRHLVEDQDDPLVQQVLRECEVWVTPMLNPDGNARDTRTNANSIDLNRHYPFHFTPGGNHGDAPAVEPEVAGNVAFLESHELDLYLTLHTGTVALIHSWGWTEDPSPDAAMFERFRGLSESYGVRYGQASHELYIVEGSSKDYGYGVHGVPSFTFEVDGQQTNQISRREDIASRLSDELELTMALIEAAPLMNAKVNVTDLAVNVEGSGDDARVRVMLDMENPSYSPANNTTVTVEVRRGREFLSSHSVVVDVPAEGVNSTTVTFEPGSGDYDLRVLVGYRQLLVENATLVTLVAGQERVQVEGGFLSSGGGAVGLWLLLAAAGVAALYLAWRHGWRPGWAVRRLTGRPVSP